MTMMIEKKKRVKSIIVVRKGEKEVMIPEKEITQDVSTQMIRKRPETRE
jgi:hypothetical protein